jgi:hypothetical protein
LQLYWQLQLECRQFRLPHQLQEYSDTCVAGLKKCPLILEKATTWSWVLEKTSRSATQICTNGPANMTGVHAGLVANFEVVTQLQITHWIIHHKMVCKQLKWSINNINQQQSIKSSAPNSQLLAALCNEWGPHIPITECWSSLLSRGLILGRLYSYRGSNCCSVGQTFFRFWMN